MSKYKSFKHKVFDIIQIGDKSNFLSRAFDFFIVVVIFTNIIVLFLETFDECAPFYNVLTVIEKVTAGIFCVEYALRIWTADILYDDDKHNVKSILRFMRSYDGVVDLLTIIPAFFLSGFVAFRMLRVVRIFHLFRLNSQYDSFNVITSVIFGKKNQLISSVFIILILMMASSLCMYSAEHDAQPQVFKNAFSGIWWSVSTVLTVGYGDIYPVTVLGRVMAILIAFMGVLLVAIPTGIISAGFVEQYRSASLADNKIANKSSFCELSLADNRAMLGRKISEIEEIYGFKIKLIIRDKLMIIPTDEVKLIAKDKLLVNYIKGTDEGTAGSDVSGRKK